MVSKRFDVAILLGSENDKDAFNASGMTGVLEDCGVYYEVSVISADRNEEQLGAFCQEKIKQGVKVFIAVAGLVNALAGLVVAKTKLTRPVIGVGLGGNTLAGEASLFSLTFKPRGAPLAATGLDKHGLVNAALLSVQILALCYPVIASKLEAYVSSKTPKVEIGWFSNEQKGVK